MIDNSDQDWQYLLLQCSFFSFTAWVFVLILSHFVCDTCTTAWDGGRSHLSSVGSYFILIPTVLHCVLSTFLQAQYWYQPHFIFLWFCTVTHSFPTPRLDQLFQENLWYQWIEYHRKEWWGSPLHSFINRISITHKNFGIFRISSREYNESKINLVYYFIPDYFQFYQFYSWFCLTFGFF